MVVMNMKNMGMRAKRTFLPWERSHRRSHQQGQGGQQLVGAAEEHPEVLPPAGLDDDQGEQGRHQGGDGAVAQDGGVISHQFDGGHLHEAQHQLHDGDGQHDDDYGGHGLAVGQGQADDVQEVGEAGGKDRGRPGLQELLDTG